MRQGTRKGLITMAAAGGLFAMSGGTAFADAGAQGDSANSPGVLSGNTFQAPVNITVNICGNTVSVIGLLNPASGNGCAGLGSGSEGTGGTGGGSGSHEGRPSGQSPQGGRGDQVTGGGSGGNGAHAGGSSHSSPGVGSGNDVQVPVDVPVNVCGNTVDVGGVLNPAHGNGCADPEAPGPVDPGYPEEPGKPGEPENPGNPGEPETPHHPENPGNPGNPGDPGNPDDPEHPGQPDEPGGPDRPGNPDEPTSPDSPQTPDQPGSTGEVHAASQPVPAAETPDTADAEAHGELAHTGAGSQLGVAAPLSMGLLAGGYVLYRRSRVATRR
ncbi:DUF320 domain-containing protein [Streptomyces diacarni]|uniref:DUF320 domain-containing protein n=1 Tax=Streptomyces diacarni TaxID=2800381 RepID=A0A367FCK3_9ACTN|nr:chaplin [Streptomyces diacarni]RCG27582.1 DUF320 domain-containing protein [Streptomyces diacarni]